MSTKLIIVCPGRPIVNGSKRRTFHWNPTYGCYVHENRVFDESEFNSVVEGVFKKNADLRPFVKVVASNAAASGVPASDTQFMVPLAEHESLKLRYKKLQERIGGDPVPPVATISGGAEITLEAALEVVQRLAPERLRKTSTGGRKPNIPVDQMAVG